MTRKAYTVGPNPTYTAGSSHPAQHQDGRRVVEGAVLYVEVPFETDTYGDVRGYDSMDGDDGEYAWIHPRHLTPVPEVDDSGFNTETGMGFVGVNGRWVYLYQSTTAKTLRNDADYFENEAKANRAVADWLEAREAAANDPVKKATALLNGFNEHRTNENVAKYLIENGVVFP